MRRKHQKIYRYIYRDRNSGRIVAKKTWQRSRAHGGTRYVRSRINARLSKRVRGTTKARKRISRTVGSSAPPRHAPVAGGRQITDPLPTAALGALIDADEEFELDFDSEEQDDSEGSGTWQI